ncbi:MAG TPA: hypothetical protein VFL16_05000 [Steroidobacteraceae bacterium]|nr:hypothetical protein [Steroidobacteraceae bacterium]HEX5162241.1 hypothetical protein [Steroidobacteraceae bacterium]
MIRQRGTALQFALFWLAVIAAVSTAAIGIYKAYIEFVAKPKEPTELARLRAENDLLTNKLAREAQLVADLSAKRLTLSQELAVIRRAYAESQATVAIASAQLAMTMDPSVTKTTAAQIADDVSVKLQRMRPAPWYRTLMLPTATFALGLLLPITVRVYIRRRQAKKELEYAYA